MSSTTVDRILEYTLTAANALQDVAGAAQIPFVGRNTKSQKEQCLRIVDYVHHLLCILMARSIDLEHIQSPQILEQIGQFTVTLQKVDSCLREQQDRGTIRRLFKQSELATQLRSCEEELKQTLRVFTVGHGA
ncbi:hypothetical protein K438DRAFT_1783047 [Mycena galopus ATCC 62051]|nr:hypothetical protein K438DRAFT_1783047 [Mycena galopus ATCC 62051]